MATKPKAKKPVPYAERTDDEKLISNWKKARLHYANRDWSATVLRVATSTEIAANIYVRSFFQEHHGLPTDLVDALLLSANGVQGKFHRLILPAAHSVGTSDNVKPVQRSIDLINRHRNAVVHSGEFRKKNEAKLVFHHALEVIRVLAPEVAVGLQLPVDG